MIDPKKIPEMSYAELEGALMEMSLARKAMTVVGHQISIRMDELAAEKRAVELVASLSPAEREQVKKIAAAE